MQPSSSREMQGGGGGSMASIRNCLNSLQELHQNGQQQQQIPNNPQMQQQIQASGSHFDHPTHDDFLDQMLSNLPSWPDVLPGNPKSPWDLNPQNPNGNNNNNNNHHHQQQHHKLFNIPIGGGGGNKSIDEDPSSTSQGASDNNNLHYNPCDESSLLASRLRQHQISGTSPKSLVLQQQLLLSAGAAAASGAGGSGMSRSPSTGSGMGGGESVLFPLPLTLGSGDHSSDAVDAPFKSSNPSGDGSVQALFNGLTSLARAGQVPNQQHFHHTQAGSLSNQSFGGPSSTGMNSAPAGGSAGGVTAPTRQKVRARRGQATDPHSIAERLRRERIAERMKALQELVPNANKTDKASMLDEIIDYVKFLQLQVKVLSMSRLGGAAAVAPLVADISSEGGGDCIQAGGAIGRNNNNGTQTAASANDSLSVTEHQVAKLMEEDMGSAMQYLQGKGLCLMPISLATAISTATAHSRNPSTNTNSMMNHNNPLLGTNNGADGPTSPSMSVLTVQSAGNGVAENSVKDATSVSKP